MPRKPKRAPPKPQARPSGRELAARDAAAIKRLANSPHMRAQQEIIQRFRESPRWQQHQRGLAELVRGVLAAKPKPVPKPRKKGAGSKPKLSDRQIADLQQTLRLAIEHDPGLGKHDAARAWLRRHSPARQLNVSDSTLYRCVTLPVLGPRRRFSQ